MSLDIGQLEIVDWHTAFESPAEKQTFVDKANLVGIPCGMVSVTTEEIDNFAQTYALRSWTGQVVGMTACKWVKSETQMFVGDTGSITIKLMATATIGSTVLTKYKGNNLALPMVAHATAAGFSGGAEICKARSTSPSCVKTYEKLGYTLGGTSDDGKHNLAIAKSAWNVNPPNIVRIDPPSFTDGGRYD